MLIQSIHMTKAQVVDVSSDENYLTTAEVARRLDVKPATVYAYVSRGLLSSVRSKGRRGSLFAEHEVDQLVSRARDGRQAGNPLDRVATRLSLLDGDDLYYRGRRATDLAARWSAESVAHLLWSGELADRPPFSAADHLVAAAKSAIAALPATARLTDQLRIAVTVLGAADPLRFDLSPKAVTRAGETLLAALVRVVAPTSGGATLAEQLWPALSSRPAQPHLLNAALVLLADHDLAVSTVAARVAASARAHPYAVVSAGLGALDGQYHGVTSSLAYRFLAEALADPVRALSDRLRVDNVLPGFGHCIYRNSDPRAELLLDLLRKAPAAGPVLAAIDTINAEMDDGNQSFPNVDLALAALMHAYDMQQDAGEAIFAIARTAGWIAHAIEEYQEPGLRFRPVGLYVGEPPSP
jgi:citrate synthase